MLHALASPVSYSAGLTFSNVAACHDWRTIAITLRIARRSRLSHLSPSPAMATSSLRMPFLDIHLAVTLVCEAATWSESHGHSRFSQPFGNSRHPERPRSRLGGKVVALRPPGEQYRNVNGCGARIPSFLGSRDKSNETRPARGATARSNSSSSSHPTSRGDVVRIWPHLK